MAAQLAGNSWGYVPQPLNFGPPPGGGTGPATNNTRPIDEATFGESVHAPEEFEATLFAAPPKVSFPVAIACEPTGAVYVGSQSALFSRMGEQVVRSDDARAKALGVAFDSRGATDFPFCLTFLACLKVRPISW